MTSDSPGATHLDHFFSSSAARLDRWRELNAKAQAWAADAHGGKPRAGRAAVEAALGGVARAGGLLRLSRTAADEGACRAHQRATMPSASARMVRRMSGALLSGSYRYDGGEWETADDAVDADAGPLARRVRRRRELTGPTSRRFS